MDWNNSCKIKNNVSLTQREQELVIKAYNQGYQRGKEDGLEGVFVSKRALHEHILQYFFNVEHSS